MGIGVLSGGEVKWKGRKFNHVPESSAEIQSKWSYTSSSCSWREQKNFTYLY